MSRTRFYVFNGRDVTAAEFAECIADLFSLGWTLEPPKDERYPRARISA